MSSEFCLVKCQQKSRWHENHFSLQPGHSESTVIPFFFETWLAGRRKLGSQHPDTMASIYSLAVLLKSIKKFKEAEELFREHLAACDSPSMLSMSFSLPQCYDFQKMAGSGVGPAEAEHVMVKITKRP